MRSNEREWVNFLEEVFERLSTKNSSISYDFESVVFETNRIKTKRKIIPQGIITLNGKLTITAGKT